MDTKDETKLSQSYWKTGEGKGLIRGVGVCVAAAVLYFALAPDTILGNRYTRQPSKPEIRQEQVLGTEKPEIYLEYKGVRYFSHVDGRDISDLVK